MRAKSTMAVISGLFSLLTGERQIMNYNILLIDDEENIRNLLCRMLELEGFTVFTAANPNEAEQIANSKYDQIHVILSDVRLGEYNGIELSKLLQQKIPNAEIVIMTAYGNIRDGVEAIKSGIFDYLTKTDDSERLISVVCRAAEKASLKKRVTELEKKLFPVVKITDIKGKSIKLMEARQLAAKVAGTDATVLITGETGTGKEIFARAIHFESNRASFPILSLNCASYSKDLLESELFGHKAGAFTGALKDKKGLIEEADGGTLFLDEIGELGIELQPKLLRFLENGKFYKLGSTRESVVDLRVIAATNRDLQDEILNGRFRSDLYYRLSVFTINLPSLNERREDIPELIRDFVAEYSRKFNKAITSVAPEFIDEMVRHHWKGNIRELKNLVERAVILSERDVLSTEELPVYFNSAHDPDENLTDLKHVEKTHIKKILSKTGGNKTEAAKLLNIGLTTLYRKIEEYGLQ